MAEKINATCSICGKGYYQCLSCKSDMKATPWKQYTDTSEHYKIFQVIRGYNTGVYTKSEAKEKLKTIDLSDLNDLRDNIKKIIKDITKEDKKNIKVSETIDAPIEELPTEVVADSLYTSRKKRNFEPVDAKTDFNVE